MDTILDKSTTLRNEGQEMLHSSGLLNILSNYGVVHETGSYKYDVMLDSDIDLHVINPQFDKPLAQKLLNALIDQGWWNCYNFHNWVDFHKDIFPVGYYLGLKRNYRTHRWKVDLWLVQELPENNRQIDELFNTDIGPDKRKAILLLKEARDSQLINASSVEIYRAVLNQNVLSVADFQALKLA